MADEAGREAGLAYVAKDSIELVEVSFAAGLEALALEEKKCAGTDGAAAQVAGRAPCGTELT